MCSHVNYFEIARTPDESRRKKLELLVSPADVIIALTSEIILRAKAFESSGLKAFDAMHLACAETQADVLLTVDDSFLKKAALLPILRISVKNPLTWLEEVLS
jgi:predicted nucleic acid-binding protein